MFEKLNKEALKEEQKIQENIYKCIDEYESFVFYAGAGAGKTYALKESLRYLLKAKQNELTRKNQKIICITYTNVAVNEIKKRIGNTDLVLVSTIHERMWSLIKDYQKELILIHKEKLIDEITKLSEEINLDKVFSSLENKEKFIIKVLINRSKLKILQNLKSKEYKIEISNILNINFSNTNNFKRLIKNIIKKDKYEKAIEKIDSNEVEKVEYDMFNNFDRLEKMKFSHDTLLEYSYKMINRYDNLKKIIVNKYPYFFVDEFQDTNEKVIDSLKLLMNYATNKQINFLVGYFGDAYQKIYSDGIGKKIINEQYLKKIEKKYNRRSANEIINLINKIRNDGLSQKSIYDDANGGKIELKFDKEDYKSVKKHIDDIIKENSFDKNNKLHILFLKNKLIAKFSGFEEFYNFFSINDFIYYNDLATKVMSKDITKLHKSNEYIYKIIRIFEKIKSQDILSDLIDIKDVESISLKKYKKDIFKINQKLNEVTNFIDLFNAFIEMKENNDLIKILHKKYMQFNNLEEFKNFFIESLNIEEEKYEELNNFLKLDIGIFINWYKYIVSNDENILNKVVYHTYHGTKGEEYENVLIVMENSFRKNKNEIKNFFINNKDELNEEIINLLYVSFSRAKKNLFIYYIDKNLDDNDKKIINDFIKGN